MKETPCKLLDTSKGLYYQKCSYQENHVIWTKRGKLFRHPSHIKVSLRCMASDILQWVYQERFPISLDLERVNTSEERWERLQQERAYSIELAKQHNDILSILPDTWVIVDLENTVLMKAKDL